MDLILRIAIKAFFITLIFVFLVLICSIVSSNLEKVHCSITIEKGIKKSCRELLRLLETTEKKIQNKQPLKAFSLLIHAKQIISTISSLYPTDFIVEVCDQEDFQLANQTLIEKLNSCILDDNDAGGTTTETDKGLRSKIAKPSIWGNCLLVTQILERKARTEATKQLFFQQQQQQQKQQQQPQIRFQQHQQPLQAQIQFQSHSVPSISEI